MNLGSIAVTIFLAGLVLKMHTYPMEPRSFRALESLLVPM